jgi:hypothetical protein
MKYMRIKSDEILFANSASHSNKLVIVPTDDERLKIVLIPEAMIDSKAGSLYTKVNTLMQNVAIEETKGTVHLYVPSFKAEVTNTISPIGESLQNIKTKEGIVCESKFSASLELSSGNYQEEGLTYNKA